MAADRLETVAGLPMPQPNTRSHLVGVKGLGVRLRSEMRAAGLADVPGEGQAIENRPPFASPEKQPPPMGVKPRVLDGSQVKQAGGVAVYGLRGIEGEGLGGVGAEAFHEVKIRGLAQLK